MYTWTEYREIRKLWFGENRLDSKRNYKRYQNKMISWNFDNCECKTIELAPLPSQAVPTVTWKSMPNAIPNGWFQVNGCNQEGNNPMRYNDNYAVASVSAPESDTATQRNYFLSRLSTANNYSLERKIADAFNLYTDNTPKTFNQLIDAVKNGKYKLDEKRVKVLEALDADDEGDYYMGPFDGIIWDGPQPDRKGFDAANEQKDKLYTAAKDIIMSGDAAAMAKAVQDFEAWTPTPTTTAQ